MFIKIEESFLEKICQVALRQEKRKVTIYKDIQNSFYGKYMDNIVREQFQDENKDSLNEALKAVLYATGKEAAVIKSFNLQPEFVFYIDHGRNQFNVNIVNEWKEDRKKSLNILKEESPNSYMYHDYMNDIFKKTMNICKHIFQYLPNTYYYDLVNIDSDYVAYLHKYLFPDSLHILVSTDKDYTHMVSTDPYVLRYFFLSSNRRLETYWDGWKWLFPRENLTDEERKKLFYNYPVFHALVGDSSDSMKTIIARKGLKFWINKLKDLLDVNSFSKFRESVVENIPFDDLLKEEVKSEQLGVSTYWDIYRRRQLIVDFYFTTIATLPESLLREEDKEVRSKILSLIYFLHPFRDTIEESINCAINKKEIMNLTEFKNIISYLNLDTKICNDIIT